MYSSKYTFKRLLLWSSDVVWLQNNYRIHLTYYSENYVITTWSWYYFFQYHGLESLPRDMVFLSLWYLLSLRVIFFGNTYRNSRNITNRNYGRGSWPWHVYWILHWFFHFCFIFTGNTPIGELFNPGYDCSKILDSNPEAKDGMYFIHLGIKYPISRWGLL